jgi:hypothetical protein
MRQPWRLVGLADRWPAVRWISPALWGLGAVSMWRRHRRLAAFVAFGGALFAAYAFLGPSPAHAWHEYPILLALDVLFLLGAGSALGFLTERSALRPFERPVLAGFAALAVLAASLHTFAFARAYRTDVSFGFRDSAYHSVAAWTREHIRPGRSFLALEVGTLGYETRLRMIDPFGLINDTNDYPGTRNPLSLCFLVMRTKPDLILASADEATTCFARIGYTPVKWFEWRDPWSVVLVRSRDVLRSPSELEALRDEVRKQLASAAGRG